LLLRIWHTYVESLFKALKKSQLCGSRFYQNHQELAKESLKKPISNDLGNPEKNKLNNKACVNNVVSAMQRMVKKGKCNSSTSANEYNFSQERNILSSQYPENDKSPEDQHNGLAVDYADNKIHRLLVAKVKFSV